MNFALTGTYHGSSTNTPIAIENLRYSGATPTVFYTQSILKSRKIIANDKLILEPCWMYVIHYKDVQVYYFDALMPYYIENEGIEATNEQLETLVLQTHKKLQAEWNYRKTTEVNFFPSVPDLTTDETQIAVENLKQTFSAEL